MLSLRYQLLYPYTEIKMKKENKIEKIKAFIKKHPILTHFVLIIIVAVIFINIALLFLDIWTGHGDVRIVPDIKGLYYTEARQILKSHDLIGELSDSVYNTTGKAGTVVEQTPKSGTEVKPDRKVYLTINAFTPRQISLPAIIWNGSFRQAASTLKGLGIDNIEEKRVVSEYKDLVLAIKYKNKELKPGARIPINAKIVIEVGKGLDDSDSMSDSTIVMTPEN